MKKTVLVALLSAFIVSANAQNNLLTISPQIKLPKDTIQSSLLISSLNEFLTEAESNAKLNNWVLQSQYLETTLLLDELEGLTQSEKGDFKPHLIDVSPISKSQFLIQLSYIGLNEFSPEIRANIMLVAHQTDDKYLFSSPLKRNTQSWKTTVVENYTFHYQNTLNLKKVNEYIDQCKFHDNNLNVKLKATTFYLVEDGLNGQTLFGLPYKLDYNGHSEGMFWRVFLENEDIYVANDLAFYEFDPHDLWHNRLSKIKSRRTVNHSVDEGIACLYGGSWGLNWKDLFITFESELQFDKHTDWLQMRKDKVKFKVNDRTNNSDFMINALIVQKIKNEHGFKAVLELLNAKEETAYFETLETLTGITKTNYNKAVWKLVKSELANLEIP